MALQNNKPILGVIAFNLLTLLVFLTAPVNWKTDNVPELCLLVLFSQVLLYVGFRLGNHAASIAAPATGLTLYSGRTLIKYLFAVYVLTFPISYAYRMGFAPTDLGGMLRHLVSGMQDPHFAYAANIDKTSQSSLLTRSS